MGLYSEENAFYQKMINRKLVGKIMNFSNMKKGGGGKKGGAARYKIRRSASPTTKNRKI